jgi:hypothetical protein
LFIRNRVLLIWSPPLFPGPLQAKASCISHKHIKSF